MTQQAVKPATGSAIVRDKFYINGKWVEPAGKGTIDVVNPATEEVAGIIEETPPSTARLRPPGQRLTLVADGEERTKYLQAITATRRHRKSWPT
jgi:acyl-CoA reductase-like NAD-dependent aldehyde dehydrogenase